MRNKKFLEKITLSDKRFENKNKEDYKLPKYEPTTHYLEIANSKYYQALVVLRNNLKQTCDFYWGEEEGAYNVDLFMMTPSISSPMGPGSDSESVQIKFGNLNTNLVDSSQFGFEPILLNGIDKVYCYLPSMRGENPDKRHLNQFYHCEAEIIGTMDELTPKIELFVKFLSKSLLATPNIIDLLSVDSEKTKIYLHNILSSTRFVGLEFSDAIELLKTNGFSEMVNSTSYGSDISSLGERKIMEILETDKPIWIKNFDRDRVAFYQKPRPDDKDKVINADLLFPSLTGTSFWGEIVGSGQRQDTYDELLESLKRQGINHVSYDWYLNLRKMKNYKITAGFGLGMERFISWALGRDDIKDVILYPRLKNIVTYP